MSRSILLRLSFLVAALLLAAPARARSQSPAEAKTATADSSVREGSHRRDSAAASSRRAREIAGVRVTAERSRRAGSLTRTSRTATKTDTPLRDTPQSATVLTRTLIADQAMQSMADAVRFIPGVGMAQGEG